MKTIARTTSGDFPLKITKSKYGPQIALVGVMAFPMSLDTFTNTDCNVLSLDAGQDWNLTNRLEIGVELKNIIRDMRDWVEDCAVDDEDLEDRQDATDKRIVHYVLKQYSGGVDQFLADGK